MNTSCFYFLAIKTIILDHSSDSLMRASLQSCSDPSRKLFHFISWKGFDIRINSRD